MNKVNHGTPRHDGPALCDTCRHATIVRGLSINDDIVQCSELSSGYNGADRIRFKVTACSQYSDRRTPTLGMMTEIAWQLRTDQSGQKIGFMSPDDFAKAEKSGRVTRLAPLRDPLKGDYD